MTGVPVWHIMNGGQVIGSVQAGTRAEAARLAQAAVDSGDLGYVRHFFLLADRDSAPMSADPGRHAGPAAQLEHFAADKIREAARNLIDRGRCLSVDPRTCNCGDCTWARAVLALLGDIANA